MERSLSAAFAVVNRDLAQGNTINEPSNVRLHVLCHEH